MELLVTLIVAAALIAVAVYIDNVVEKRRRERLRHYEDYR